MARDATARLYDVQRDSVVLTREPGGPEKYAIGTIRFSAKKGKLVELDKLHESIRATRLSGGTRMRLERLEVTASGELARVENKLVLKVRGSKTHFELAEAPDAEEEQGEKSALRRLLETFERGEKAVSVRGHVDGWSGPFPGLLNQPAPKPRRILVENFETGLAAAGAQVRSPDSGGSDSGGANVPGTERAGEVITNSIGMKLAPIPAGTFVMGSNADEKEREASESPHEVTITKPFYMGVYEVTQAECQKVLGEIRGAPTFDESRGGGPDHPMENILWSEANSFCEKLSALPAEKRAGRTYRLPTEAEWEFACRAGSKSAFHVGAALSSRQANFNGKYPYGGAGEGPYLRGTTKVGSYPPNAFGLYDMHGNVSEWCADWYAADYYRSSSGNDPTGPAEGVLPTGYGSFYLVVRGGCWLDDARACRSACRQLAMPENRYRLIGFRVVCEVRGEE